MNKLREIEVKYDDLRKLLIPEGYEELPYTKARECDYWIKISDIHDCLWYSSYYAIPVLDDNVGDIKEYKFIKRITVPMTSEPNFNKNVELKDLTIRELQTRLPWTIKYSSDFRTNPQPHKDFAHGLIHIMKAAGKLAQFVDDMDHNKDVALGEDTKKEYGKYIADMVVCALRMANTFPNGILDLQREVQDRLETKNNIKLIK